MAPTTMMMSMSLVSATTLIGRQSLDNTVTCQHTSIDRKIAAHHEGTHSRILLSQPIGFVCEIRLVLPAIDQHQTGVARGASVGLIQGVSPTSTSTQTCSLS